MVVGMRCLRRSPGLILEQFCGRGDGRGAYRGDPGLRQFDVLVDWFCLLWRQYLGLVYRLDVGGVCGSQSQAGRVRMCC